MVATTTKEHVPFSRARVTALIPKINFGCTGMAEVEVTEGAAAQELEERTEPTALEIT